MTEASAEPKAGALVNLACAERLKSCVEAAVSLLQRFAELCAAPTRREFYDDNDIDPIHGEPAFIAFIETLPEELECLDPSVIF